MEENNEIIVNAVVEANNTAVIVPTARTVTNSTGQEIVTYGTKGEILSCQFGRVDFDAPATILSYCDDVKNEISAILDSTAQMALDSQEAQVDEKMLNHITSFEESLDDSEKKREKEANQPAIIKGIKGILATLGVKRFEEKSEEETTYKGRYEKYCEGLEEVSEAVESQKQGALNDINLRNSIISEITPYIEILEEMIKVGEIDKATYDATIEELKLLPQDQDTMYAIQYKTQLSEVFNGKLHKLSVALVALKEQVQTYRIQNGTDMQAVMEATTYISDIAPLLKAQGSVMVFNRQQENRIRTLAQLNDAANTAMTNNARDLEQNALAASELSLNSGITVETLKVIDQAVKRGITIYQNTRHQKQAKIAQEKQALLQLSESLDSYQQELLQLADDATVREELLKGSSTSVYRAPQKKLGSKTTKKGRR